MPDPLDDLLATPAGPFSPMDPMEFNAPEPMVEAMIRVAIGQFAERRDEHTAMRPDDVEGQLYHQQRVQSAINALAWVQKQRTPLIKIGLYPIDVDSELEMYEELLAMDPTLFTAHPDDLPGLTQDATQIRRTVERITFERPEDPQ